MLNIYCNKLSCDETFFLHVEFAIKRMAFYEKL